MEGWPALVVSLLAALDTAARVPAGMIRAYLAAESRPNAFKGNPCLNASRGALVFSRARRGTGLDVYNYEGPGDARGLPDKFELCLHVFWLHAAPPSTRHTPGQKPRKDGCGHEWVRTFQRILFAIRLLKRWADPSTRDVPLVVIWVDVFPSVEYFKRPRVMIVPEVAAAGDGAVAAAGCERAVVAERAVVGAPPDDEPLDDEENMDAVIDDDRGEGMDRDDDDHVDDDDGGDEDGDEDATMLHNPKLNKPLGDIPLALGKEVAVCQMLSHLRIAEEFGLVFNLCSAKMNFFLMMVNPPSWAGFGCVFAHPSTFVYRESPRAYFNPYTYASWVDGQLARWWRLPCPHGKFRTSNCVICTGCPHGKLKRNCADCNPCPHGKRKSMCAKCNPCPHGKLKDSCVKCNPCAHGKLWYNCVKCNPCPHGKLKQNCAVCNPCPHGARKGNCAACNPCPHGARKGNCAACNLCPHGKHKYKCDACKAARASEPAPSRKRKRG